MVDDLKFRTRSRQRRPQVSKLDIVNHDLKSKLDIVNDDLKSKLDIVNDDLKSQTGYRQRRAQDETGCRQRRAQDETGCRLRRAQDETRYCLRRALKTKLDIVYDGVVGVNERVGALELKLDTFEEACGAKVRRHRGRGPPEWAGQAGAPAPSPLRTEAKCFHRRPHRRADQITANAKRKGQRIDYIAAFTTAGADRARHCRVRSCARRGLRTSHRRWSSRRPSLCARADARCRTRRAARRVPPTL